MNSLLRGTVAGASLLLSIQAAAQTADPTDPPAVWRELKAMANALPDTEARDRFLFEQACAEAGRRRDEMEAATAEVQRLGSEAFSAFDRNSVSEVEEAAARFGRSIGPLRETSIAMGYFVALCDEYTQRVREVDYAGQRDDG